MNVLLSIKPKYAEKIFCCLKFYEFRKIVWHMKGINKVWVYSSSPVKQVVGYFTPGEIISGDPHTVWHQLRNLPKNYFRPISLKDYASYFDKCKTAHAIEILNPVRLSKPESLFSSFAIERPPQNFCYVPPVLKTKTNI